MNKLRTIIVDDEPLALDLLRSYLAELPVVEIVAECKNGTQAISAALQHQPDLMFLDIQMPGMSGLDVIKNLQSDVTPLVVFVTAYDEYALAAFDVHAVDYILKPLDAANVERAVARCALRLENLAENNGADPGVKSGVINAINSISEKPNEKTAMEPAVASSKVVAEAVARAASAAQDGKILIKDGGVITLIDQSDIDWVDAAGDYMCIHANNATHIMRSTLKNLLAQLNPDLFKRVHRSTIVNLKRIQKVIPHSKGECFLELGENERVKVSRNYRSVIKDFLTNMQK